MVLCEANHTVKPSSTHRLCRVIARPRVRGNSSQISFLVNRALSSLAAAFTALSSYLAVGSLSSFWTMFQHMSFLDYSSVRRTRLRDPHFRGLGKTQRVFPESHNLKFIAVSSNNFPNQAQFSTAAELHPWQKIQAHSVVLTQEFQGMQKQRGRHACHAA